MHFRTVRRKDGKPDLRIAKREDRLAKLEKFIDQKPRTVDECARYLGVYTRTVYFLFDTFKDRGQPVARDHGAGARYTFRGR
jgi:predicted DNA-binding transcriptional regulator YafY